MALGAAAGASLLVVTATGDALFLGVLLGLVAADVVAGGVGVLAALGVLGRWGSASLAALAGGQAVLGPAGWTGSAAVILSSWGGALALVLVAPPGTAPAVAFGLFAAQIVAGPAVGDATSIEALSLRAVVSALAVGGAWLCARYLPRAVTRPAGLALAAVAMALAFLG